jgi:glyoxylase-like metal-dependent hydrolase (beta-lactamase superfamily II)
VSKWIEVAEQVFARRHEELDQTLGLIVGSERCLVVDSGTNEMHGQAWRAAIREVTTLPWDLLITHAHWDHFFGTAAFTPCPIWAHPVCQQEITNNAEEHRARGLRYYRDAGLPVEAMSAARVVPPTELVPYAVKLDLAGRSVVLFHPGRGHTGGDVVAHVPDAGVLFAGDLVEEGAPPAVGSDAYPAEWPSTMDVLLSLRPNVIVPGHGNPVDQAFVAAQRDELAAKYVTGAGSP